jgi:hypothetical protein
MGGNGEPEDTGSTIIPEDDTGRNDDTGEDPGDDTGGTQLDEYPEPWHLGVQAAFGYDSGTNEIRDFTADDNGNDVVAPPTLGLRLLEQGPGSEPGPIICTIQIQQESPIQAQDLGDGAVSLGWMIDWSTAKVEHDCEDQLDPSKWGSDIEASLADAGLGVGITGEADPALREVVEAIAEANDVDFEVVFGPWMVGARIYLDALGTVHNGSQEFWYARGMEVDERFSVLWLDLNSDQAWQQNAEPPIFHAAEDLLSSGDALPTGAYLVDPGYILSWGVPLDELLFP